MDDFGDKVRGIVSFRDTFSKGFMISYLRASSSVTKQKPYRMFRMKGVENSLQNLSCAKMSTTPDFIATY